MSETFAAPDPRFFRTLWNVCDGTATEAERVQLENALLESDTLCDLYLRYTALHVELMWQGQADDATERWSEILGPEIVERPLHALAAPVEPWWRRRLSPRELAASLLGGVLFTIYVVVISWRLTRPNVAELPPAAPSQDAFVADRTSDADSALPTGESVGTLTTSADAQWESPSGAPTPSDSDKNLRINEPLRLATGTATVHLRSGATVLVAGPSDWTLKGDNEIELTRGTAVARVPSQAIGFTVVTPTARFVDLGTEFGVQVDETATSRLYVFRGKVLGQPLEDDGPDATTENPVELGAAQAMTASRDGHVTVSHSAEPGPMLANLHQALPSRASLMREDVLAHWRFENPTPTATGNHTQCAVVTDASGHLQELDYWPGSAGRYASSTEVPPAAMFAPGYRGGEHSFNPAGLIATAPGVLFHDSRRVGDTFTLRQDFTIEGYFKTAGDQSAAGPMTLLYKSWFVPQWEVVLNLPTPGALSVVLIGSGQRIECGTGGSDTAKPQAINLADGKWHYFAARVWRGTGKLALTVGHEDGTSQTVSTRVPDGFRFDATGASPESNLFVGRKTHLVPIERHFFGSIDEVRISRVARDDTELMFPISPDSTPRQ